MKWLPPPKADQMQLVARIISSAAGECAERHLMGADWNAATTRVTHAGAKQQGNGGAKPAEQKNQVG
jgi:hypothetical protein